MGDRGGYAGGVVGDGGGVPLYPLGIERREVWGNSEWRLARWFDSKGNQTRALMGNYEGVQGGIDMLESAGHLISGMDTKLYSIDMSNHWLGVDPVIHPNAPIPIKSGFQSSWTFPAGWYVVGARANIPN